MCTKMKQPLQQLLEYPYEVLQAHVKLIGCAQHGVYNRRSHECHMCPDQESCKWVNQISSDDSRQYSVNRQVLMLEHALDSMMSYARLLEHDVNSCNCTNCKWIQRALKTYNELLINNDQFQSH